MKALLSPLIGRLLILLRDVGPYAAIELLLPGGTVVALLYWWYRHRLRRTRDNPQSGAQTESVSAELSTRPWCPPASVLQRVADYGVGATSSEEDGRA